MIRRRCCGFSFRACLLGTSLLLTISPAAIQAARPDADYHLIRRIPVGGEGGWDFLTVDPDARRIYISRGAHVMVVDEDSGNVVGDIPDTQGVHAIVILPEFGRGFSSNGNSNTVTIFDLKTLSVIKKVPTTGLGPNAMIYDSASKHIFTFHPQSNNATAIDPATGNVVGTIGLGGGRTEFATADGQGHIFVHVADRSQIVVFNSQTLIIEHVWPLAPCEGPTGMAIDTVHRRIFSGCGNKMMAVVDADSGRVITTLAIGPGVDATGFDPATGLAFSSNGGDGTLTVVHQDSLEKFSIVAQVPTQKGARTMALDPRTHHVFVITADFGPAPEPTADNPRPRPQIVPNSFVLLELGQ
jgi:YVTN family beta-propeller protein